jgi:hypothetical protein
MKARKDVDGLISLLDGPVKDHFYVKLQHFTTIAQALGELGDRRALPSLRRALGEVKQMEESARSSLAGMASLRDLRDYPRLRAAAEKDLQAAEAARQAVGDAVSHLE